MVKRRKKSKKPEKTEKMKTEVKAEPQCARDRKAIVDSDDMQGLLQDLGRDG